MKREKLKVGIVGLGRLGKEYAKNLMFKINNADLIAACSLVDEELRFAKEVLGVPYLFSSYTEMLQLPELEAIYVVSSTDQHADHMIMALESGKHVFSEKPLALDTEECYRVKSVVDDNPELTAVVGFVRRYDQSYLYAKRKVDAGDIGEPFMVRSQTVDKDSIADFQMNYVLKSGGIFHDFNVHDIDLARWFLNAEFTSVHAIGGAFKHKGFGDLGDADNVMTTCTFDNGSMAVINASRTGAHGHDTYTEVVGTEGTLRIGRPSYKNRVEIYDQYGARKECVATFWERFDEAFLLMAKDFIDCILDGRKPELSINDAIKATEVANAFTQSFRASKIVHL